MIRDITIGQYYQGSSPLHRADPRTKILLLVLYIILLFSSGNRLGLAAGVLLLAAGYFGAKIPFRFLLKSLKPIVPIVVFTAVLNLFFVKGEGAPLVSLGSISIYKAGVLFSVFMVVRIVCMIAGASLLTYTTTPIAITDGLELLLGPLKKIKVPVHEMAMMMSIALRFIPTLVDEMDKIMNAQKARGADMESGSIACRAKALIPVLIPLFVSAFRRAEELALAMESRCYHGGKGRTRMRQFHLGFADLFCALFMAAGIVGMVLLNMWGPRLV